MYECDCCGCEWNGKSLISWYDKSTDVRCCGETHCETFCDKIVKRLDNKSVSVDTIINDLREREYYSTYYYD